jgi:small subunit ribosomal protein S6
LNTLYEGLFIFPETMDEEALEMGIARVKEELEALGGSLESTTRVGKKNFARPMNKQKAGHYVVMMIKIDGSQLVAFKKRLTLASDVFRSQIVLAEEVEATQEG